MQSDLLQQIKAPQIEKSSSKSKSELKDALDDNDTIGISKDHREHSEAADREKKLVDEKLKGLEQDREQRKEFSHKIYALVCIWLGLLIFILCMSAWGIHFYPLPSKEFFLSDNVLIALITGTSANIIGLMAIVILYLFPKSGNKDRY